MLRQLGVLWLRRWAEEREHNGNTAPYRLAAVQESFRGDEQAFSGCVVAVEDGLPRDDRRTVEQHLCGCALIDGMIVTICLLTQNAIQFKPLDGLDEAPCSAKVS